MGQDAVKAIRTIAIVALLVSCRSHHEDVTPAPAFTDDPCPVDFTLANADAWPRCSELGPLGLERTYFQLGIHPCRVALTRNAFSLSWGSGGRLERQAFGSHVVTYHYDAAGHLATADDVDPPHRHAIKYERDAQGRLVKVDDDGVITAYTRDASGNITAIESTRGEDHDSEQIHYENGLAVSSERTSDFGGTSSKAMSVVERDEHGRRVRSKHHTESGGTGTDEAITFAYDPSGRLASLTWVTELPSGSRDETLIQATYDAKGRLATLDEGGRITTFGYDCP